MSVIGVVRLSRGQVGFFDDLTRIHLTIANPEKAIVEGMNTATIKRAIKSGRIQLISGTLEAPEVVTNIAPIVKKVEEAPVVEQTTIVQEPIKVEEPVVVEEAPVVEAPIDEAPIEEVVEIKEEHGSVEIKAEVRHQQKKKKK